MTRALLLLALAIGQVPVAGAEETVEECGNEPTRSSSVCLFRVSRQNAEARAGAAAVIDSLVADHPQAGWPLYYRSRMERHSVREPTIREATDLFAAAGDISGEIRARADLVLSRGFERDFSSSFGELERLRQLVETSPFDEDRAIVDIAEAHYRMLSGTDLPEAYSRLRDALAVFEQASTDYYFEHRECLRALTELTCDLGMLWEADDWAAAAVDYAQRWGTLRDQASTRYDASITKLASSLPTDSLRDELAEQVRETVSMAEAADDPWIDAASRLLLADLIDGPEVTELLLECRRISAEIGDLDLERNCILALAAQSTESDPEEARRLLDATRDFSWGPWTPLDSWQDRMHVLWATHSRDKALEDSNTILSGIEALRRSQIGEASDLLLSASAGTYYWISGKLLDGSPSPEDVALSFAVIERLRAQTLRETLLSETTQKPSPEELSRRIPDFEQLKSDYRDVYRGLLNGDLSSSERQAFLDRLSELERRESQLRLEAAAFLPARIRLVPPGPELLGGVEESLAEDEALLSYQLGTWRGWDGRFQGGSWLTVATSSAPARVYRLDTDRGTIEAKLGALLGLDDPDLPEALAGLYDDLLDQALSELPDSIRKLIIVPDGALHLLPFSLLRERAATPPLVERYEVQTIPSASLWLHWRDQAASLEPDTRSAFVMANPEVPRAASPASVRAWALASETTLGPLPHAEREGRRVIRRLGGNGELQSGPGASEALLKSEDLSRFSILHFASHAVVNPIKPGRSAIMLAAGGEQEDGFLRPSEIAQLGGLVGKLVVLSACDTAAGSVLRGEGVLSLGRAFFEAGAQAVVASLWRLDDRLTTRFFDDFYRHLRTGVTVSQALAETQREWSRRGQPAAVWAGIVVLGNGNLVPIPGGVPTSPWKPVAIVAAALLIVLAGLAVTRRGRLARSFQP